MVLAAGSALLANQMRAHRAALQDRQLHTDVRSAMDWVARELRKAQYSANAGNPVRRRCAPIRFANPDNFSIMGHQIDFSHDRDHDGIKDDDECMGFRLTQQSLHARRSCSGERQLASCDRPHPSEHQRCPMGAALRVAQRLVATLGAHDLGRVMAQRAEPKRSS